MNITVRNICLACGGNKYKTKQENFLGLIPLPFFSIDKSKICSMCDGQGELVANFKNIEIPDKI